MTTLEDIFRRRMITHVVSRTITCPVTGHVLDTRTCIALTDPDGDPAYVLSPEGWSTLKTHPETIAGLEAHGLTRPQQ